MAEYRLELKGVCKSFPGVKALDHVQLALRPGTVHALMGENGAGKSTLMKCLFGIYKMDAGEVYMEGEKLSIANPDEALKKGIAMVHQELQPVPARTVAENFFLGRFPVKKIGPMQVIDHKTMNEETEKWMKEIKMEMEQSVGEFINGIRELKLSFQQYHVLLLKIFTEMYRFCGNNQLHVEAIFGANLEAYTQVLQMNTIEDLEQWMLEKSNTIQSQLRKEKTESCKSFVDKAVEYVENHYSDQELTIDLMCDYLGVSSAYFSTVFKKETGKTFINYLTDYRMEKAVDLLMYTNEKTYVIAEKTGYSDPNYFSYVFKKKFGVSPSKYKANEK